MATVHEAARRSDVEGLRQLLSAQPGLADIGEEGGHRRPLHCACYAGCVEAVQLLLDHGAWLEAGDKLGATPLSQACAAGRVDVVRLLLARGANPLARNGSQMSVLMAAAFGGDSPGSDHVGVIRLLLSDGRVPIDAVDADGRTALHWACSLGRVDRARVLLYEGGADHFIFDESCRTARSASYGLYTVILQYYCWWSASV